MSVKRYQPVAQCVEPSYQTQMIEPKVMEFSEGEYVLHSDYAYLKAENERLRKAGDELSWAFAFAVSRDDGKESGLIKAWNAAKEGKPSV